MQGRHCKALEDNLFSFLIPKAALEKMLQINRKLLVQ